MYSWGMPTVCHVDGWRFFFYSNEGHEPPHIHVESGGKCAKLWVPSGVVAKSRGYNAKELGRIQRKVRELSEFFVEAWYGHFGY